MAGCLVDTTVLVHAAEFREPEYSRAKSLAQRNQPALLPGYALRELLAGRVQILCDAHNRVLAAEDPAAAISSILRLAGFSGRTTAAKATAIADAMSAAFQVGAARTPKDIKREILQDLMTSAARLWRKAARVPFFEATQPLSCGSTGSLEVDALTGAVRGPGNTFSCSPTERCSAALYMYEHKQDLEKLIAALHPDRLPENLAKKQETQSRRKALKELLLRGPKTFDKRYCRALGDAYFAVMCPAGHSVATSNRGDFEPLCAAVNKQVTLP